MSEGVEWLNGARVPAEWQVLPVKRVGAVVLGKMLQSGTKHDGDALVPYMRAANVQPDGNLAIDNVKHMWMTKSERASLTLQAGDIVVVEGGIGGYGRAAYVPDDRLEGWGFQNSINRVRVHPDTDARFLTYALLAVRSTGFVEAYCNVVSMPHLTAEKLSKLEVPIPPLAEQRAIADYLDHETTQLDALVAKQVEFIRLLGERRISLISDAVLHGLSSSAASKPSGADWFNSMPAHWCVDRLKHSIQDAQVGVWGDDPLGDGTDVLCVRVADFDRSRLRVGIAETRRAVRAKDVRARLLEPGDLLLEKSGGTPLNPVGFVAMYENARGPAVTSNFITRLRLKAGQNPRYWLYAHATSYATRLTARSVNQTTGIQNLNQASYLNELFPYPQLEEQCAIATYLDDQTTRIDALIAKAQQHIALAHERRSALITAAVTGQIDVRTAARKAS